VKNKSRSLSESALFVAGARFNNDPIDTDPHFSTKSDDFSSDLICEFDLN